MHCPPSTTRSIPCKNFVISTELRLIFTTTSLTSSAGTNIKYCPELTRRGSDSACQLSGQCGPPHYFLPFPVHLWHRSLVISPIPVVSYLGNHCTNSEGYAASITFSRNCTRFRILYSDVCTREPLTVQRHASGVCGRTTREICGGIYLMTQLPVPSRSRISQTFRQVTAFWEHLTHPNIVPVSGYYYRLTPTDYQSDAEWGPDFVHRESPGSRQDESRKQPFCFVG